MLAAGVGLLVQRLDAHARHQRADVQSADLMSFSLETAAQQPAAGERMLQVQFVDAAHQRKVAHAHRPGPVVRGATADVEQLGLTLHRKLVVAAGLCLRSAVPPW